MDLSKGITSVLVMRYGVRVEAEMGRYLCFKRDMGSELI